MWKALAMLSCELGSREERAEVMEIEAFGHIVVRELRLRGLTVTELYGEVPSEAWQEYAIQADCGHESSSGFSEDGVPPTQEELDAVCKRDQERSLPRTDFLWYPKDPLRGMIPVVVGRVLDFVEQGRGTTCSDGVGAVPVVGFRSGFVYVEWMRPVEAWEARVGSGPDEDLDLDVEVLRAERDRPENAARARAHTEQLLWVAEEAA